MKKRLSSIPFYVMFGILVIFIIIGAFKDLEIESALYLGRDNQFGLFFAAIGVGIPFFLYSLFGGYMFSDALYHQKKIVLKILILCYAIGMSVISCIVSANEFVGYDAYNIENGWYVYVVAFLICGGLFTLGFIRGRNNQIKNVWIIICLMIVVMLISYEGIVNLIKHIMHRPRYRAMVDGDLTLDCYRNFFERFNEYEKYIALGVNENEFKSFPSGHACTSCLMPMMLCYLPIIFPKLDNKRRILFYIGVGYSVFICFTRFIVGAHFLSDVSVGFLSTILIFFMFNKLVEKKILK